MTGVDSDSTRVEAIVAAHEVRWYSANEIGDEGHCACGLTVTTEEQWVAHVDEVVIAELWTPTSRVVSTTSEIAALPMRSAILVRPGRENIVYRRLFFDDSTLHAWSNLNGQFRDEPWLLPALLLEEGPFGDDADEKRSALIGVEAGR